MQKSVLSKLDDKRLAFQKADSDRLVFESRFVPLNFTAGRLADLLSAASRLVNATKAELSQSAIVRELSGAKFKPALDAFLAADLVDEPHVEISAAASDIGYLFLERTRIRPQGLAIGEQIFTLSLAPGEEVVVEQKAFSERQTFFEEVSERGEDLQNELSSTLTSDLQNTLAASNSENQSRGWTVGVHGSGEYEPAAGGEAAAATDSGNFKSKGKLGDAKLSVDVGYADSVSEADTNSRQRSVRNSQTLTSKASATLRSQHKITFRISETSRFESGSKRTIRNPNAFTPVDLVYYKMMQTVQIAHERFGVRLCWAPQLADPGAVKRNTVTAAKDRITREENTRKQGQPEPLAPAVPNVPSRQPIVRSEEMTIWISLAAKRMNGDQKFTIKIDDERYMWDGNVDALRSSLFPSYTGWGDERFYAPALSLVSAIGTSDGVEIVVHGEAQEGGLDARLYANFRVGVVAKPTFQDQDYLAKYQEWQQLHAVWLREARDIEAATQLRVEQRFARWLAAFEQNSSLIDILLPMVIQERLPADKRDSFGEVALWNTLFDLANASVRIIPGLWQSQQPKDPLRDFQALENASWAQLFLPIRVGFEKVALDWLYSSGTSIDLQDKVNLPRQLMTQLNEAIADIVSDIESYREKHFGGVDEVKIVPPAESTGNPQIEKPFICLAQWQDVLPNDGTHLEVVQGATTAADSYSRRSLDDAHEVARQLLALREAQAKTTLESLSSERAEVHVNIGGGSET